MLIQKQFLLAIMLIAIQHSMGSVVSGKAESIEIPSNEFPIHQDRMEFQLKTTAGLIQFNLKRAPQAVPLSQVPVLVNEGDGKLNRLSSQKDDTEPVVFRDESKMASFVFHSRDDGAFQVHGIFSNGGAKYRLKPSRTLMKKRRRFSEWNSTSLHELTAEEKNDKLYRGAAISSFQRDFPLPVKKNRTLARRAAGPAERWIEVLVVADYDIYLYYKGYLGSNDTNRIIRYMKIYYALVLNEVDLIFQDAFRSDPDVNVHVRLVGYVFNTARNVSWIDQLNSPDLPDFPVSNGVKTAYAFTTLDRLVNWTNSNNAALPRHDFVFGYTGRDLYDELMGSGWSTGSVGYSEICNLKRSASITEDMQGLRIIAIQASRLAFSLGAGQDGDPNHPYARLCSASDNYIMSAMTQRNGTFQNEYKFSNCSIQAIKNYITVYLFNSGDCLKEDIELVPGVATWLPYYPGQLYDANQQCQLLLGRDNRFCSQHSDIMCTVLFCQNGNTNDCNGFYFVGAATGTPCAIDKWCHSSACVSSMSGIPPGGSMSSDANLVNSLLGNLCAATSCQNGGICSENVNGITCTCPAGYSGFLCETKINPCFHNPCLNGGSCNQIIPKPSSGTLYTCACPNGWTGLDCSSFISKCSSNPCQNGGNCSESSTSFVCACPRRYTGSVCQVAIDECLPNPCLNGGTCNEVSPSISSGTLFLCSCANGWSGTNCAVMIDMCSIKPCQNGGTCNRTGPGTRICMCSARFTGEFCENRPLSSSPESSLPSGSVTTSSQPNSTAADGQTDATTDNATMTTAAPTPSTGTNNTVIVIATILGSLCFIVIIAVFVIVLFRIRNKIRVEQIRKKDMAEESCYCTNDVAVGNNGMGRPPEYSKSA